MKKTIMLAAMSAILAGCVTKNGNEYAISGRFEGFTGDSIWLVSVTANKPVPIDSMASDDGCFSFSGTTDRPLQAAVASNLDDPEFACAFIIEPGNIEISITPDSTYRAKGTKANDMSAAHHELIDEINSDGSVSQEEYDRYRASLIDGLKNNTDNYYGLTCLENFGIDGEEETAREFLDMFPEYVRKSDLWIELDGQVNAVLSLVEGKEYIAFEQKDADGGIVSSKEIMADPANKYVLIDFWASWCGPCMRELPSLKKAYSEYSPKGFQIIGVSLDYERDEWLDAVKNNDMNWIHVSDMDNRDNILSKTYGVRAIPTSFLVDCKTGIIVARNLRGDNVSKKLAELLK